MRAALPWSAELLHPIQFGGTIVPHVAEYLSMSPPPASERGRKAAHQPLRAASRIALSQPASLG
jgi:hypothetical protein